MAVTAEILVLCSLLVISTVVLHSGAQQLSPSFYDQVCPQALPTIQSVVERAIEREPRIGASLLRLHFHDCFVNGCDGSILLDDTGSFVGEKTAAPNLNSARGFEIVDEIKAAVNEACHGNVVSCADILAVAARDSVCMLGGQSYEIPVGRRDARTASKDAANNAIPAPSFNLSDLISNFQSQGLSAEDLVVLSGAHTLGFAQCTNFRDRAHNDTNIDPAFAGELRARCPRAGSDSSLAALDGSPARFDTDYFGNLVARRGLLHSDQELLKGGGAGVTDGLVSYYSGNWEAFAADFCKAMVKMGNIRPLTGNDGEIRMNCRRVN